MNLGIILASGDSFSNMAKSGQDVLFKKFYIPVFAKEFDKVYIFSYAKEKVKDLPENVQVIPNTYRLHRYLYGFLMPFLNASIIFRCDVFRVYHLFGTLPAIIASVFFAKPFVFNFAYDYEKFSRIDSKYLQIILLKLVKPVATLFASKIFAANRAIFKGLPVTKTVYLPNGVDLNFFKPIKKNKINKVPVVLSVGRLEKQKNFESLVEAIQGLNIGLILVGNGSLKSKLLDLAKVKKVDLKIIEKVKHNQMPKIYNQADIFVLPSLVEGHPKTLLEAMACSCPVVVTNVEGTVDIVRNGQNGLMVEPEKEKINYALRQLIGNKILSEKLAKNARETIDENFNIDKLFKREVSVLKTTISP